MIGNILDGFKSIWWDAILTVILHLFTRRSHGNEQTFLLAFSLAIFSVTFAAEPIPDTGWGTVLKVPIAEVERVEQGLIEWSNWIKDTHPLGGEENGLESLTITKSYEFENHVIYVVVERYRDSAGLRNHQKTFQRDVRGEYSKMFAKLSFFQQYRISGSEQNKTLVSIIPSVEQ